jgi:hypothetical protein
MKLALTVVTLIALGGTAHAQQGVISLSQHPPGSGTSYGISPTYGGGDSYDKPTQPLHGGAYSGGYVSAPMPLPSPPPAHHNMMPYGNPAVPGYGHPAPAVGGAAGGIYGLY